MCGRFHVLAQAFEPCFRFSLRAFRMMAHGVGADLLLKAFPILVTKGTALHQNRGFNITNSHLPAPPMRRESVRAAGLFKQPRGPFYRAALYAPAFISRPRTRLLPCPVGYPASRAISATFFPA